MPGIWFLVIYFLTFTVGVAINVDQVYCFMCEPYHEKSCLESTFD